MRKQNVALLCLVPTFGIVALVGANQSVPELSAEQIIPTLSQEQRAIDKTPGHVSRMFAAMGGDPSETRYLGKSATASYYGGPANDGEKMCIQIVGLDVGEDQEQGVACTSMAGMAAAGLRIDSTDGSETVWLTPVESIPEGLERALAEQADAQSGASLSTNSSEPEVVWVEQSPHFYVKTTTGGEK